MALYTDHQRAEAISIFAYHTRFYHVKMQSYDLVEVLALQIFTIMVPAIAVVFTTTNHMKVNINIFIYRLFTSFFHLIFPFFYVYFSSFVVAIHLYTDVRRQIKKKSVGLLMLSFGKLFPSFLLLLPFFFRVFHRF